MRYVRSPRIKRCVAAGMAASAMCIALMLAGCAMHPIEIEVEPQVSRLPSYIPGTTYIYSDGSWETVVSATENTVTWKNHRGYQSSGAADFTFRRAAWETRTRQGQRRFSPRSDVLFQPAFSLWPLQDGKVSGYREDGLWQDKTGTMKDYTSIWSCTVDGSERVSVLAGEFDTRKIVCKRFSVDGFGATRRVKEVKTWYYAPDAGHPVLTTSTFTYRRPPRRLELMAVIPPEDSFTPDTVARIRGSLQRGLESNNSGEPLRWGAENREGSGHVVPLNTFQSSSGTYCRQFRQELTLQGKKRGYYGIACRNAEGRWVIPRGNR